MTDINTAQRYRTAAYILDGMAAGMEEAIDKLNWNAGEVGGRKFSTADLVYSLRVSADALTRCSAIRKARYAVDLDETGAPTNWFKLILIPVGYGVRWHTRGDYIGPAFGSIAEAEDYLIKLGEKGEAPNLRAKWIKPAETV